MKKILLIATGGTIASLETAEGLRPGLNSEELLDCIPEIRSVCDIDTFQLMNIDSTNMTPDCWLRISACIEEHYDAYDGFVITHGTDTMAYTAAALSYLVQHSPKPIVLTGAQKSIYLRDTDARRNLSDSFLYAADDDSSGVTLVFNGDVILGTRARKERTKSYNAFNSVDYPPIAVIREHRIIRYLPVPVRAKAPHFYNRMNDRVLLIRLIPGMRADALKDLMRSYDALILQTFGSGGLPGSGEGELAHALREWTDAGKTVVVMTQVPFEGSDLAAYSVGYFMKEELPVIEAHNRTDEAVVTKLMWILGRTGDPVKARSLFAKEISHDII